MIKLQNLTIGYGEHTLLCNVSTEFHRGCVTALIGRNGTGKSTLLRALAALNHHYSGRILVDKHDTARITPAHMARLLSFVTTQRIRISNLRCRDVVAMGRAPYTNWIGNLQPTDHNIVNKALELVGMSAYSDRSMDTMSDGECQRIMIARALAQDTPAILLDEPTSFLDMPNRYETASLLRQIAHTQQKCIIYSTHELDIALNLCDTVALIDSAQLLHLPTSDMKTEGHIDRLFHVPKQTVNYQFPL